MAKKSGLGGSFWIGGYDLSGDVSTISNAGSPRQTLEVTGLDKSAIERIMGLSDGNMEIAVWFNDAALQEHVALSTLPTADRLALYAQGGGIGDVAAGIQGKQINYDWTRGVDGSLAGVVQVQGSAGVPLEWMVMLTAGVDVAASSGSVASKDDSASSASGLAAILQVVDIDSGTPTVVLEDSANDSTWATLISFTAVANGAEPTAERKTVAGTVDRYLRVTTTGTFTNLDYALAYRRGATVDDEAYV